MTNYRLLLLTVAFVAVLCSLSLVAAAQDTVTVLAGPDLTRIVPSGFYFQGLSAQTQTRNSAAARFGKDRYVISGIVDTSGYSVEVRARYEGFFITDSPISVGGSALEVGAYGFGFTNDSKFNLMDLAGKEILSVATTKDANLRRPRPLMMVKSGNAVRLYSGRDYVEIGAR